MIGQISQPQRSAPAEGGAIQPQLRHTTSSLAGYDAVVDRYAASEAGPHVGDSATSVGGAPMPEFEDRQLLTSRSRGPGSGGLLIGQSASLGGGRPVGAALGAASPFEMGRMSQGALDRVNQAFNSSLFHLGAPGPSGHDAGARAFIAGGVHAPSEGSSDAATLENGCTPGSIESTSSAGHGDGGAGGGQGMGYRDQGGAPPMGATVGGPPPMVGSAPGTRSQELSAGLYYQPAAAGQPYLSVAQGMPGMPQTLQGLQGLPHSVQNMPHYGSLSLPGGLIGAGGPPIGGAIGGNSLGGGAIGGGSMGGGVVGGAAGYMQFPVGSSGGGNGGGANAPIGRASHDWFAGAYGAAPPPPPGGARIGRSSFDEDRFRKPIVGSVGGAPIGSGLPLPLIGSGAGPLIGGMPAPLAGAATGHAGAQALVPGGPLLSGMAMGADHPLALGVGQISLPASTTSLPYPAAPISAGEAAAVDFGSALYNMPGGGGGGLDAGVLRRSSSLEAGLSGLGSGLGSGIGSALGALEHLQGGLAPRLAVPPSVFSASTGNESVVRAPSDAARTNTGSHASSGGGRAEAGPPLVHMGSVAEDSVFDGDDAPRFIKARRGELQATLRGDSANLEQAEVLSHTDSARSDGSRGRRNSATKVRVVCSSGGHFARQGNGYLEYEGGETRLVSVANFCSLADLQEALERVAAARQGGGAAAGGEAIASGSSTDSTLVSHLKYQLPSEPHMYVDLVDDEDVQLMFDEWADFAASNRGSSYKLHIFIEWSRPGAALPSADASPLTGKAAAAGGGSLDAEKISGISIRTHQSSGGGGAARAGRAGSGDVAPPGEAGAAGGATAGDDDKPAQRGGRMRGGMSQQAMFQDMAGRMEIISPDDVTLVKFLGSGGYGEVYMAKWLSSEVAVKCLNPGMFFNTHGDLNSNAAILDLLREADLLGSLRHPNVVWVFGIVLPRLDDEGVAMEESRRQGSSNALRPPAMVTEYMSQGSLKMALARKADVVQGAMHRLCIAMDAAKGMAYLHAKSIVHFDLKSANLLLGYRDRRAICKVADFGLSKQKRDTYVSNVTSQRGTLPWIAPEIIKTPNAVTERVDVYSFGVVLWELWTGREPYEGLNYHALLHQITTSNGALRPPLPGKARWDGEVPPEPAPGWSDLCERCWGEDPAARPDFEEIVCTLKNMAAALRPPRTGMARPAPPPASASSAASSEICAAAVLAQSTHGERIGAAPRPASPPPASYAAVVAALPQPGGSPVGAARGTAGPFAGAAQLPNGGPFAVPAAAGPFAGAAAGLPSFGSGQAAAGFAGAAAGTNPAANPFAGAAAGPSFGSGQAAPVSEPASGTFAGAAAQPPASALAGGPFASAAAVPLAVSGGPVLGAAAGPFGVAQQLGYVTGHMGGVPAAGVGSVAASSAPSTTQQSHGAG